MPRKYTPRPVKLRIVPYHPGRDDIVNGALCRDMVENGEISPEKHLMLFWPGPGIDTTEVRAICGACPVEKECREYALEIGENRGIYGGTTGRDRRIIRQRRKWAQEAEGEAGVDSKTPPRPGRSGGRRETEERARRQAL